MNLKCITKAFCIKNFQQAIREGHKRCHIVIFKIIIQTAINIKKDVIAGFIDHEKAFDKINYEKLFQIVGKHDIDNKDLRDY